MTRGAWDEAYEGGYVIHYMRNVMSNEPNGLNGEDLIKSIESNERMTPQEKLHAKLFYHETLLVKDMDTLTLRAHIEELSHIAFEARARHGAATAEEHKRAKGDKKAQGFQRSLNTDPTTSDAINIIKERQKKLTKAEQLKKNLEQIYKDMGLANAAAEAEKVMSARNIAGVVKAPNSTPIPVEPKGPGVISNPFARKREEQQNIQAAIDSIVNAPEPSAPIEKKAPFNPFAKKAED
jgi:hypothetical protein